MPITLVISRRVLPMTRWAQEDAVVQSGYEKLTQKTTIGCEVRFEGIPIGRVEGEVTVLDSDSEYKHFLQRIRLYPKKMKELKSQYAYRWCYWAVGERGGIQFGQYALLRSNRYLRRMLASARKQGWQI